MKAKGNILIVDDDIDVLETARMFLKQEFSSVDIELQPEKIAGHFERKDYDVVLLDMNFKKGMNDGEEGFYWLGEILKMGNDASVILITAYGEIDLAIKAMKEGATDFVLKPWKNQKLLATIMSAMRLRESRKEVFRLKQSHQSGHSTEDAFGRMIGRSMALQRVKEIVKKVGVTDADVLILGENGTGKEVVARAIHAVSPRRDEVFVHVDLGAISETLFESELFGHVKGAFTDARQDKPGRFEVAQKGTVFLDEIGNLSLPLQAKLLTVLQNKKVKRVGSHKDIDLDVRMIYATNRVLTEMVAEQTFRQDLLYRINTVEIRVPALRERREDVPLLVDHFLKIFSAKYHKPNISISSATLEKLQGYPWPGNIRELQHAVERAVILSDTLHIDGIGSFITVPHTPEPVMTGDKTLDEMERDFILHTLERHQGNVTKTAQALGLTRTALYRRMNKYGI